MFSREIYTEMQYNYHPNNDGNILKNLTGQEDFMTEFNHIFKELGCICCSRC